MYRIIMNDLMEWYEKESDKVLLLKGAKGVGKTWAMIDFGQGFYKRLVYVDLEKDEEVHTLFRQGSRVRAEKLMAALCMYTDQKYEEGQTLFVFDEVHLYPKAIEAVMSLKQQRPDLHLCMIASTVGTIPHEAEFVQELHNLILYPMTFEEFLTANKAQDLCKHIEKQKLEPVEPDIIDQITEYLKVYYVTGGMPIVVLDYVKNQDLNRVDAILRALLGKCKEHIDKYVPKTYELKVNKIWNSIPLQMKKENRKFMYQYVDEKARAREYEKSVNWLVDTGFVRKVNRIKEGIAPLELQVDDKSFELYHLDHGLLRVMCGIPHARVKVDLETMEDINGALLEQLVLSELTMNKTVDKLYFWISGATARVDFVFEDDGQVVPVDVQSRIRRKAQSVKVFNAKYKNHMAIRISLDGLSFTKGVLNIPLYGLWNF
ncbi:MAG: ATP-binding protein [Lachnospiraceae bacterium]|nr:ATP-binding protein [Lachnospiraceae bacterium]